LQAQSRYDRAGPVSHLHVAADEREHRVPVRCHSDVAMAGSRGQIFNGDRLRRGWSGGDDSGAAPEQETEIRIGLSHIGNISLWIECRPTRGADLSTLKSQRQGHSLCSPEKNQQENLAVQYAILTNPCAPNQAGAQKMQFLLTSYG